jgi:hypothetical protein
MNLPTPEKEDPDATVLPEPDALEREELVALALALPLVQEAESAPRRAADEIMAEVVGLACRVVGGGATAERPRRGWGEAETSQMSSWTGSLLPQGIVAAAVVLVLLLLLFLV